jgi:anti-sigma B factor antagonist
MKIEIREDGKVRVLDLHGRLVLGPPADLLKDTIHRILAEGHNRILLNLRGVPYMDSAGIGELAACKKRVLERHGEIKIQRTPGKYHLAVETLIELMFQDSLFDDETKALVSFS